MNELKNSIPLRGIAEVTNDIRIQTGMFLRTAIEIGRLLFEAKGMVEPGGWSAYIESELPFSHSWANNYMKLYKEYGSDQTSLFGDSRAMMSLRPTQALELLALPAERREEFVQSHDMEELSTRQLRKEVQKELEEAKKAREDAESNLSKTKSLIENLEKELAGKDDDLREMAQSELESQEELKNLRKQAESARDAQSAIEQERDRLKQQLEEARDKEAAALEDLKKARENPEVPDSVMEQLRKEVEADAAKRASEQLQKKLDKVQAALEKANAEKLDAEEAAAAAQAKLANAQKAAKISDPNLAAVQVLGQKLLADWNTILGYRMKAVTADPGSAAPLEAFLRKMLEAMEAGVGTGKAGE